jgi:hypothetical protein
VPAAAVLAILSNVPADSLRELKLVSRVWHDFIVDPFQHKRLPQTLEGFFHGRGDDNYGASPIYSGAPCLTMPPCIQ